MTILAHGCPRLVKLELSGCEGSYDGVSAIGQCCQMLEELTLYDHRMDVGWIAALSFCENLKTLRLIGCKKIDPSLHLQRCQLRGKDGVNALFLVCAAVWDIVIQDCWGLDSEMFSWASVCRYLLFIVVSVSYYVLLCIVMNIKTYDFRINML